MQFNWIEKIDGDHKHALETMYAKEWWTKGRTAERINKMLAGSDVVIGCCNKSNTLVGFARVLTDYTYKAFIFDVIVATEFRSSGLGREILQRILNHPDLAEVVSFELYCPESLIPYYQKNGFELSDSRLLRHRQK